MIIPCHGGAALTRECLTSLFCQAGEHELEILLVDNARDEQTAALADAARGITVLPQPHNLGFAGACNRGLERATMPFVLVLNNDTQAARHLLTRLHDALAGDDRIAFAAPTSNRVKGAASLAIGDAGATAAGRDRIERELCPAGAGAIEDVDTLSGLCLLGRRETWARLHGFDERFVPGNFEDDDLSLRARLAGYRLVVARGAFLHHEAHQTFRALGLDIAAEVYRQHAVFRAKWQANAAGQALLASIAGDFAGAAAAAERAQRTDPAWPDADWHLGKGLADRGQFARAADHFAALLQSCPRHSEAILQLGRCWLAMGEAARAKSLWCAALARDSFRAAQGARLLSWLGEHAHGRGDLAAAAADFAAALEFQPADAALQNRLGAVLVELRRFDEAIPLLERAAAAGLAIAHTNLGICRFQAGDAARALEHFAAAATQLPNDLTAQQNYQRARAAVPTRS